MPASEPAHPQQETGGATPWRNGDWPGASSLARAAPAHCRLAAVWHKVAYRIWNEGDSDPTNPRPSASAENFAPVRRDRRRHPRRGPDATIVWRAGAGKRRGLCAPRARPARGRLPVDALAYHPYGRYVEFDPFYNKNSRPSWTTRCAFSNRRSRPLWITGWASPATPIGPSMRKSPATCASRQRHQPTATRRPGPHLVRLVRPHAQRRHLHHERRRSRTSKRLFRRWSTRARPLPPSPTCALPPAMYGGVRQLQHHAYRP